MMAFAPGTVFTPKNGARMSREQASRYGPELAKIQEHMGRIEPEAVVEEARPKSSPLHDWFEWNGKEAAELYRITQAREMLRSIEIVVRVNDKVETTKGFHNVIIMVEEMPTHVYVSSPVVFSKPALKAQVVAQAYSELQSWKLRYAQYQELAEIFKPVLEAIEKITPPQ